MNSRQDIINALEVVRKSHVFKKNGQDVISLDVRFVDMILALLKDTHKNTFTVIDKHTGEYPNVVSIARRCKWANNLIYCDIDQFVISEDGTLMLTDDCGNVAYCPADRFEVIWDA